MVVHPDPPLPAAPAVDPPNSLPPPPGASALEVLESELGHLKRVLSRRISELHKLRQEHDALSHRQSDREQRVKQLEAELSEARVSEALALARLTESRRSDDLALRASEARALQLEARLAEQQQELSARGRLIDELRAELEVSQGWGAPSAEDDLTQIFGIGPKLRERLRGLGVTRIAQIASWTEEDIVNRAKDLGIAPARITRDAWVKSARELLGPGQG